MNETFPVIVVTNNIVLSQILNPSENLLIEII